MTEPQTVIVIWRHSPRGRWQVQPFVHSPEMAARVGGRLVDRFGGEAWALPIVIPGIEDPKDLERG